MFYLHSANDDISKLAEKGGFKDIGTFWGISYCLHYSSNIAEKVSLLIGYPARSP
jgi:hypothetical protein